MLYTANWHKWSMRQGHETISFGSQGVTAQVTMYRLRWHYHVKYIAGASSRPHKSEDRLEGLAAAPFSTSLGQVAFLVIFILALVSISRFIIVL